MLPGRGKTACFPESMPQSALMPRYRLAVLGDPVEHSRSPELHAAMLALSGLEGTYERIRADAAVLASTVDELRRGEWHGLNVTMPLKGHAADLADRLSPPAATSRSVNTLQLSEGSVHGHSTDAAAITGLFENGRFGDVSTVLVIGAGGSSAAVLAALGDIYHVYVAARRPERAAQLTSVSCGEPISWGTAVAGALVINTTPLGMHGEALPENIVSASSGLVDLPYASERTPAVVEAATLGIPYVDGHEFLVRQAIASFRIWTGVAVEYEVLAQTLRKI